MSDTTPKKEDTMPPQDKVASEATHPISEEACAQQDTCDALCSLGSSPPPPCSGSGDDLLNTTGSKGKKSSKGCCPKQLPMFLSKTYHMIDRCDPTVATWSASGDNFVVKNVEKFAGAVLPQYFKHSNFSSFARQLNFYGFRKLKAEPILTADFDARTACYVRFYHEKFQKDRPELLTSIKRATKSDQQSKQDVDTLRMEIGNLKECITNVSSEYDRKIAEIHFEYNRRINALSADYDKLAILVQQMLASQGDGSAFLAQKTPDMMRSLSQVAAFSLQSLRPPTAHQLSAAAATTASAAASAASAAQAAAVAQAATAAKQKTEQAKRKAEENKEDAPPASRPRTSKGEGF